MPPSLSIKRDLAGKQIHIDLKVAGRTLLLKRNYRNTQQITEACIQILDGTEAGDRECLYPFPSLHQGDYPTVLVGEDPEREIYRLRDFLVASAKKYRLPLHGSAVLCPNYQTAQYYAQQLTQVGLKARYVTSKSINLKAPYIKVLTLHAAKGLEFPFVAIGLSDRPFPLLDEKLPAEEVALVISNQRRLFYVGCTRAMRSLMVCHSASPSSPFLEALAPPYWQKKFAVPINPSSLLQAL